MIIKTDIQFNHLEADDVLVEEGVTARIYGTVKNSIRLKKGAIVYLYGKRPTGIINEGGILYVFDPGGQVLTF